MPILKETNFLPPWWLVNGHFETIYPAIFRKVHLTTVPETFNLETPDGDFFELDYYDSKGNNTIIISHGLEGNSRRPYVLGMVKIFLSNGWNVIAWNYRGCNGQPNRTKKSYHSGFTEDLVEVIRFADRPNIRRIALVGFSLGGNLTLRYLGEGKTVNQKICTAMVFSVPIDLHQSCIRISEPINYLYSFRFLKSLKNKILEKSRIFNDIDTSRLSKIKDLKTFDDNYTAPLHGFEDALDYYKKCSALYILENITIPTLIASAINDPFLTDSCFPTDLAKNHIFIHLASPARGGHVGFASRKNMSVYWSETMALEFVNRYG